MSSGKMDRKLSNIKEKKEVKLGDVCEITSSTRIYASEYQEKGIPFYRGKEIIKKQQGNLEEPEKFISEERYLEIKSERDVPTQGDLLLTSVGTVGVPYVVDNDEEFYFKDGNVIWFKNFDNQLLSKYLYYWFLSHKGKSKLEQTKIGSSQSAFTITGLKEVKIDLPKLSNQKSVVTTLSAFDNLIENNKRRIEILEEMAETIYREWFVNFNFPGSRDVGMKDSDIGAIPETFEVKKLGEVLELSYGEGLRKKDRNQDGDIPVYGSSGIIDWHDEPLVEGPGIIVGRKGNVGSLYWSQTGFCPIDTTYYVRTELPLHYVYYNLQNQNFVDSSTSVPGLNRDQACGLPFLIPSKETLYRFQTQVEPIFKITELMKTRNDKLSKIRDLLLPRLISDEV